MTSRDAGELVETIVQKFIGEILSTNGNPVYHLIQRLEHVCESTSEDDIDTPIILSLFRLINILLSDEKGKHIIESKEENLRRIINISCSWEDLSTRSIKTQATQLEETIKQAKL